MTPTLIAELRACVDIARAIGAHILAQRIQHCADELDEMMLRPVAQLVPMRAPGRPPLRVIEGGMA